MNAIRIAAITLIMVGILGLAYGSFSYTKETRETQPGPIHPTVWRGSDSGWRTDGQDMSRATHNVGEGKPAERNALSDRINLHRLLAMQVSDNYLSAGRVNWMDSRRPRLDSTGIESGRSAPEVPGTTVQDALHFKALQHLCISEPIPAVACYRKIHHLPGV